MDTNGNGFSTESEHINGIESEGTSGLSLPTDEESTKNGSGTESLPLSVDQMNKQNVKLARLMSSVLCNEEDKATAPPTIEVEHEKQRVNLKLDSRVKNALISLMSMDINSPTLDQVVKMVKSGKTKFKEAWDKNHCSQCNITIPPGKPGRKCKECRNDQRTPTATT